MKKLLKKYRIEITLALLFAFCLIICSSCDKIEGYKNFSCAPTALKFTDKQPHTGAFKYHYTLLKYNNSWYSRILPDNTKKTFTDVQEIAVYSNNEKPMNRWIDYIEWQRDTSILTFRNPAIDSLPTGYKVHEVTERELFQL